MTMINGIGFVAVGNAFDCWPAAAAVAVDRTSL